MPQPTEPRPRVRHITTGDVGALHGTQTDLWMSWALVRWDHGGPGMVDELGLSRVAPGVLERITDDQHKGQQQ